MPLHDIASVTKAIIDLIDLKLRPVLGLPPGTTITLPLPPDKMTADGLSFFLYHLQENASYKNLPSPGKDNPPVRFAPMGLNLFYQLSAGHPPEKELTDNEVYRDQLMMGVAMKTLHDHPEISELGYENRFKIVLQPISYNEAVNNWTAGTSPLRLAAYYEVSVILLEPEEPTSYAGRVLQYGAFVFPEGTPWLFSSQNLLAFTLPDGITMQQVLVQPAQTPYGSTVEFHGAGFTGDHIELLLFSPYWQGAARAETWDLALAGGNRITATIRETVVLEKDGSTVEAPPGLYAARIRVVRSRALPNGTVREFGQLSNQVPFTVSPRIDTVSGPDPGGIVSATGYIFPPAEPPVEDEDLQVYLGENRLFRGDAPPGPGNFITPTNTSLELRLPDPMPEAWVSGRYIPLRILVNGAESPPNWIEVP